MFPGSDELPKSWFARCLRYFDAKLLGENVTGDSSTIPDNIGHKPGVNRGDMWEICHRSRGLILA